MFSRMLIALVALMIFAPGIAAPKVTQIKLVPSLAPMLKRVMPAVVNLRIQLDPEKMSAKEKTTAEKAIANGSGVIVDAHKGYILTNNHLTRHAKTIMVRLQDGRKFTAKLIGNDPLADVAVLQIDAKNLTEIQFANSDTIHVGDYVVAIGSPYGLHQTATAGIISALHRTGLGIEGRKGYESFIQTDASINPGNSGGALVNLQGDVVGINTAIISQAGGAEGIGLAIPSNMAKQVMRQLIKYGNMQRGMVGIIAQTFTNELANAFAIPFRQGALVSQITPHSPAAASGLRVGDLIYKINGTEIDTADKVRNVIGLFRAGGKLKLDILRHNKPMRVNITSAPPKRIEHVLRSNDRFLFGLNLENFSQHTTLQGDVTGVAVVNIAQDTPGWKAGLLPGDVIIAVNQKPIKDLLTLQALASKEERDVLLLTVKRGSGAMFAAVKAYKGREDSH